MCNIKLKIKYTVYVKLTNSIILLVNIYDDKGDDFNFFANTSFIESKLHIYKNSLQEIWQQQNFSHLITCTF